MRSNQVLSLAVLIALPLFFSSLANADDDLIGTWRVESSMHAGEAVPGEIGMTVTLLADTLVPPGAPAEHSLSYEADSSADPSTIDIHLPIPNAPAGLGIYRIEGDTLTICLDLPEGSDDTTDRPSEFSSTAENGCVLQVLSRVE